jgi:hypothetical protein
VKLLQCILELINMGHHLAHTRRKMTPALQQSATFAIPDAYRIDHRNLERLLLYDSDDLKYQVDEHANVRSADKVLLWSSDTHPGSLFGSENVHMDGTFNSSPSSCEQVFIIQAFLHGTCVPVVYALSSDRKAAT